MEPEFIEPLTLLNHTATIQAQLVSNAFVASNKLDFITFLFILQNWEMPFFRALAGDKIKFAFEVLLLQQSLVASGLLPREVENCCEIENVEVTTTTRLRPIQISNEQVVIMNNFFFLKFI